MRLNLVFHDIVPKGEKLTGDYSISIDYYSDLMERVESLLKRGKTSFDEVCCYFDDGYESFKKMIFPSIHKAAGRYCIAPIANLIGKEAHLKSDDIVLFKEKGIQIASHGFSHSALAVYEGNKLQSTTEGGRYKDTPQGKGKILSEKEVLFQLLESKKYLEDITKSEVDEFVLPYGLYNEAIIRLNEREKIYKYLSTCDEYLDRGEALRPRILITNKRLVEETVEFISSLK